MKLNWTDFRGRPYLDGQSRKTAGPRVTLSLKKIILLNVMAYEALEMPEAVELRFDEDQRIIGLKPVDPHKSYAFPLRQKPNPHGSNAMLYKYRTIRAAPFCKHFDIRPAGTILFLDIDMTDDGTMLLELDKAVRTGRGAR